MNRTIKKRWIKALTSGKYTQGRGTLYRDDTFCCLGVLCDLFIKTKVGKAAGARWETVSLAEDGSPSKRAFLSKDFPAISALPLGVQGWAGLETENPEIRPKAKSGSVGAIGTNDSGRYSFKDIAGLIEKSL